jgi:putative PEP-CTERM system TPR-repeat lipoprotein
VLKSLVVAQLRSGEYKNAQGTLRTLLEVEPESPEVHLQVAMVQLKLDDTKAARASLQQAIELQADFPKAQVMLGRLYIIEKGYDAALSVASDLKEEHPDEAYGYELEGDVYASRKQQAHAADAYTKALEKGTSAQLIQKLYKSHLQLGDNEFAYDTLRQWLVEHPEDARLRTMLAMDLQSAGQQQSAIEEYLKVLEYDANNVTVLNNLAWLYQETGSPEGVKYAERAHQEAPDRPEVTDTLGWLLVQNGDINRGLVLLQEARAKAPHIPDIHYHMAVALYKSGRTDEASKELDRLLKTGRDFDGVDEARKLREQLGR